MDEFTETQLRFIGYVFARAFPLSQNERHRLIDVFLLETEAMDGRLPDDLIDCLVGGSEKTVEILMGDLESMLEKP